MTRAALTLLTLLPLAITGCDDPPTCGVLAVVSGGVSGEANWALEGQENCGLGDASAIAPGGSALVFVARAGEDYQQIIVTTLAPQLAVGEFPGQVLFITPDDIWDSGSTACTLVLTKYDIEPWSKVDFVEFEGVVDCPGQLTSLAGSQPLTLSTVGINGHVWNEPLGFDNI